jgi:arylsulfatase A-like enzyme
MMQTPGLSLLARPSWWALAGILGLAAILGGCSREQPPGLLIISLDTTRADHCSVYGYARDTTPVLRRLAAAGALFARAYTPTPTTAPAHATVFTGRDPLAHGVRRNGHPLPPSELTLAEMLHQEGWQTAAVVSSFVLAGKFGLRQGFDHYDDELPTRSSSVARRRWQGHELLGGFDRRAADATDQAIDWLREQRDPQRSFMLFVHYFDPHDPYVPPAPYDSLFAADGPADSLSATVARYDGEIAYADSQLGRLLEAMDQLGLSRNTLVVVFGDHGEGLMQRGAMFHGVHLYEEAVHVPLLMRWPGHIPAGTRVTAPVGLISVMPTICDLLGLPPRRDLWQGESLGATLHEGATPPGDRPIFLVRRYYEGKKVAGHVLRGRKYGIVQERWKYLEAAEELPSRELYDLVADPGELVDLAAARPEVCTELSRLLAAWRDGAGGEAPAPELDDADRLRLRALGYVD